MIGSLPKLIEINGVSYKIRTDYRVALMIFEALQDAELSDVSKQYIMYDALFIDKPPMNEETFKKACWFLDGGNEYQEKSKKQKKLMDWNQDEQLIFSAVNNVAGKEVRNEEYLHWWTFLGYFNEIKEGLFSTVVTIRKKKAERKKLEKYEQEFYKNNKDLIDIKKKYSSSEQEEIDEINKMLNS